MSSILDALKKAEQQSAADREAQTPWPAPSSTTTAGRRRRGRWWIPLGLLTIAVVGTVVFWQIRRPEPQLAAVTEEAAAPPASAAPKTTPAPLTEIAPASQPTPPPAVPALPKQAVDTPSHSPLVAKTSAKGSSPPQQQSQAPVPLPDPETTKTLSEEARSPEPERIDSPSQSAEGPAPEVKTFRSDPRIELQALVWAPEAADRFVVINNRLVKEGGSVDAVEVIKINRDDVLLGEGTQRWHQAFKIR